MLRAREVKLERKTPEVKITDLVTTQPFINLNSSIFSAEKCGGIIVDYLAAIDLEKIIEDDKKLDISADTRNYALRYTLAKYSSTQLPARWSVLASNLMIAVNQSKSLQKKALVEEKIAAIEKSRYLALCGLYSYELKYMIDNFIEEKLKGIDFNLVQDSIVHYCAYNRVEAGKLLAKTIHYNSRKWQVVSTLLDNDADLNLSDYNTLLSFRLCALYDFESQYLPTFIEKGVNYHAAESKYHNKPNRYAFTFETTPFLELLCSPYRPNLQFHDPSSLKFLKNAGILLNTFPEEVKKTKQSLNAGINYRDFNHLECNIKENNLLSGKFLLFYSYEKEFKGKKTLRPDNQDKLHISQFLSQKISEAKSVQELYSIYEHNVRASYLNHRRHFNFSFIQSYPKNKVQFLEALRKRALEIIEHDSRIDNYQDYFEKCKVLKEHGIFDIRHELFGLSDKLRLDLEKRFMTLTALKQQVS